MKLFYRTKILISGIFPIENFKIDGYIQKTGIYDEKIIDVDNNKDSIFYLVGPLIKSAYSCAGKNGVFYEFFENEELFEYEIDDGISKEDLNIRFLKEQSESINLLQKKLRLITGFGITLPIFITYIYYNNNLYTYVGNSYSEAPNLDIKDYDENMKKKLEHRLSFYISDSTITDLEEKNSRFKRALNFYTKSFDSFDIGIRFTLLFSSLEALFNITAENITDEVSKYASKILFLTKQKAKSSKWKIITYYDIRSKYIHGNDGFEITKETEDSLREYVREILIIYWNISTVYGITNPQEIKNLLNRIDNNSLNLQCQMFIKYLRTEPSKFNELYNKTIINFLNKDYKVLTSKNFDIK